MRKTYRPSARVSTLIYRITANLCLNTIRDAKRRRMLSLDAAYGDEEATLAAAATAAEPTAMEEAVARERAEIVRKALSKIPDRQRIALVLHRFEGLSYADIAESMETNVDAIKALLSRARASLAAALRSDIEAGNL
jgi:RNA polymerase sigma-70 factor (ECF subfamily)